MPPHLAGRPLSTLSHNPALFSFPTQMARVVDDLAARTPGKKSLAMAAFARALRQIPTIICDNAGEQRCSLAGWQGVSEPESVEGLRQRWRAAA